MIFAKFFLYFALERSQTYKASKQLPLFSQLPCLCAPCPAQPQPFSSRTREDNQRLLLVATPTQWFPQHHLHLTKMPQTFAPHSWGFFFSLDGRVDLC